MLILSLTAVAREPVRLREQVPQDDPLWTDAGFTLRKPIEVDLEARTVGEGVLVRGEIAAELDAECRRCLTPVPVRVHDTLNLLYEPLSAEEEVELGGEVYPLPERGDVLDLSEAIREQLMLRIPAYVECSESCKGLCPQCGAELNRTKCECVPEQAGNPWDALKDIRFD
jgi:uncharacterized protein